jgi:competence protein ComEC
MLYWVRFPFLRFLIFLISGITLYRQVPSEPGKYFWIYPALFLIYILLLLFLKKEKFRSYNLLIGIHAMVLLIISGYTLSACFDQKNLSDHLLARPKPADRYTCRVLEVNDEDTGKISLVVRCISVKTNGKWETASGNIFLAIKKNRDSALLVQPGDRMIVCGSPSRIKKPQNPHQFDYAAYMSMKNIYYRQTVKAGSIWVFRNENNLNPFRIAKKMSDMFQSVLASHIKDYDAWSLVSTLVVGARGKLDESLETDFATVGISHILSVSGLHVGIIYMVLFFLLKPFYHHPRTRWLSSIIIISILIVYAFITGLTPSVLRSVFMFSLIELGRRIGRKGITLNTLAVSAFFLLCADPFFLYFVGFQLSYLAVAGIVCFHSYIYKCISFKYAFADYIWQIISVSTAAQIATLPLTIYYFHTFPVYFLLANILAIPIAFFLLVAGLSVLALNFLPVIPGIIGSVTSWVARLFNHSISFIGHLPFSQVRNIYLSELMVLLLFLLIILIIIMLNNPKTKFLYGIAICLFIFSSSMAVHQLEIIKQKKIIFYYCKEGPVIEFVNGNAGILYSTSQLASQKTKLMKLAGNNCAAEGHPFVIYPGDSTSNKICHNKFRGFDLIIRDGKSIAVINNPGLVEFQKIKYPVRTDFIVLSNNSAAGINKIAGKFSAENWIIDGSNNAYLLLRAKNLLKKPGISLISLEEQGSAEFRLF